MSALAQFFKQAAKPAPAKTTTKTAEQPADPMAAFAGIWEALAKQQETAQKSPAGIPMLDAKQLAEALGKTRIAPQVTEAQSQAITTGGAEALQAVSELLNQTAQASTMQAILASQRMVAAASESTQNTIQSGLPAQLRDQLFQQQLSAKLPNLSNPAVAPMVEMVRAGLAANNPSLTPEALTEQAAQFFSEFSKGISGEVPAGAPAADEVPEQNFFDIFGITPRVESTGAAGSTD